MPTSMQKTHTTSGRTEAYYLGNGRVLARFRITACCGSPNSGSEICIQRRNRVSLRCIPTAHETEESFKPVANWNFFRYAVQMLTPFV